METLSVWLALLAAVLLLLIAAVHVYWALGGVWPGRDRPGLAQLVLGGPNGVALPSVAACLGVAGLLALAAWTVLAAVWPWNALPATGLWRLGSWTVTGVLLLRGVLGFFDTRLRPSIVGSPFVKLDHLLYSPLCLLLSALIMAALLGRA